MGSGGGRKGGRKEGREGGREGGRTLAQQQLVGRQAKAVAAIMLLLLLLLMMMRMLPRHPSRRGDKRPYFLPCRGRGRGGGRGRGRGGGRGKDDGIVWIAPSRLRHEGVHKPELVSLKGGKEGGGRDRSVKWATYFSNS